MCYYETNHFTGCGCTQRKHEAVLEPCVIAEVYGRDCAEELCGPHPERPAAECFGLVCMDCLNATGGGKEKKSKKFWSKK